MATTIVQRLAENPEFLDFLDSRFRRVAVHATVEELAEFAFGSIEEAVATYDLEGGRA